MVPNPCFCGCRLRSATKIIAILQMILSVAKSYYPTKDLIHIFSVLASEHEEFLIGKGVVAIYAGTDIGFLLVCIAVFILANFLLVAARQCDIRKCRIWLICHLIILHIEVLLLAVSIGLMIFEKRPETKPILHSFIINTVFRIFGIWLIYAFIQEIKEGRLQSQTETEGYSSTISSGVGQGIMPLAGVKPNVKAVETGWLGALTISP